MTCRLATAAVTVAVMLATTARAQDAAAPAPATEAPPAPPLVTLHVKDVTPKDAVAALAQAAGVKIEPYQQRMWEQERPNDRPWPRVTIDADNKPFWDVLFQICDAANVQPYPHGGGGRGQDRTTVRLMANYGRQIGRTSSSPLGTASLSYINRTLSMNFTSKDAAAPARSESVNVQLAVYVDPRLRATQYQQQPVIEVAVDQEGRSLLPPQQNMGGRDHFQEMYNGAWYADQYVQLKYDAAASTDLTVLKGYTRVRASTGTERAEIPDLLNAKGQERTVAGRILTVDNVVTADQQTTLTVSARRGPTISQEEWQQATNRMFQTVKVVNASDNQVNYTNARGRNTRDRYELTVTVPTAEAHKLVAEFETGTAEHRIPFEFQDLPLP